MISVGYSEVKKKAKTTKANAAKSKGTNVASVKADVTLPSNTPQNSNNAVHEDGNGTTNRNNSQYSEQAGNSGVVTQSSTQPSSGNSNARPQSSTRTSPSSSNPTPQSTPQSTPGPSHAECSKSNNASSTFIGSRSTMDLSQVTAGRAYATPNSESLPRQPTGAASSMTVPPSSKSSEAITSHGRSNDVLSNFRPAEIESSFADGIGMTGSVTPHDVVPEGVINLCPSSTVDHAVSHRLIVLEQKIESIVKAEVSNGVNVMLRRFEGLEKDMGELRREMKELKSFVEMSAMKGTRTSKKSVVDTKVEKFAFLYDKQLVTHVTEKCVIGRNAKVVFCDTGETFTEKLAFFIRSILFAKKPNDKKTEFLTSAGQQYCSLRRAMARTALSHVDKTSSTGSGVMSKTKV